MLKEIIVNQSPLLQEKLTELISFSPLRFSEIVPSSIPTAAGVYLITAIINGREHPYYVGRTKNLQQRLYNNHLMGPLSNARLKKYLIESGEVENIHDAKQFIRMNCAVRWLFQDGYRERGALEAHLTAFLFPKYGIYEEH